MRLLYISPQACVQTNDIHSEYFPLERGTRQGCPLSPSLFALAIEPLSIMLRSSTCFKGVFRNDIEHRLSLYADDLLLYVSDPVACLPTILPTLKAFSSFSGYKINLQKSECYPINTAGLLLQQTDLPFNISHSGFKYLSINQTQTFPVFCLLTFPRFWLKLNLISRDGIIYLFPLLGRSMLLQ